jgi:hypothetical protein
MGSFTAEPRRSTAPRAPVARGLTLSTGRDPDQRGARPSERYVTAVGVPRRRLWHPLKIGLSGMLGLLAASSCGTSDKDALRMRVSELEDRIGALVRRGDELEGRVSALETKRSHAAKASVTPADTAGAVPLLQVVKLVPRGDSPEDPPDDVEGSTRDAMGADEPRPVIRGSGDRIETSLPSGKVAPAVGRPAPKEPRGGHSGSTRGKLPSELPPPAPSGTLP